MFPIAVFPPAIFPKTMFPSTVYPSTVYPSTIFPNAKFPSTAFPNAILPNNNWFRFIQLKRGVFHISISAFPFDNTSEILVFAWFVGDVCIIIAIFIVNKRIIALPIVDDGDVYIIKQIFSHIHSFFHLMAIKNYNPSFCQ